jgi:hypothetical protein
MVWDLGLVAACVRFPVVVVTAGMSESGWVSGFSGAASEPESITIRYGHPWTRTEVQVTTYPGDPFDDLTELVDSSAGGEWWSMTNRPPSPPAAPTGGRVTRAAFTIGSIDDQSRPDLERAWKAQDRAIRKAVKAANKRQTRVTLDGVATDAYMIEMPNVWAIGLHSEGATTLTALLVARSLTPKALELGQTTDLPTLVGDPPTL